MTTHPFEPDSNTGKARALFEQTPGLQLTPQELGQHLGLTKVQTYSVIHNLKARSGFESLRIIRVKSKEETK